MPTPLGDRCRKCGKRATPLVRDQIDPARWMHCPRCGITFNKDSLSLEEIRAAQPGNALAQQFAQRRIRP